MMMTVLSLSMGHFSDEFTQSRPSGGGARLEEGYAFEGCILSQSCSGSLSASTLSPEPLKLGAKGDFSHVLSQ